MKWQMWNDSIFVGRQVCNTWDHAPSLSEVFEAMVGWGYSQQFTFKKVSDDKFTMHENSRDRSIICTIERVPTED